jgi:hypothetical protein
MHHASYAIGKGDLPGFPDVMMNVSFNVPAISNLKLTCEIQVKRCVLTCPTICVLHYIPYTHTLIHSYTHTPYTHASYAIQIHHQQILEIGKDDHKLYELMRAETMHRCY